MLKNKKLKKQGKKTIEYLQPVIWDECGAEIM